MTLRHFAATDRTVGGIRDHLATVVDDRVTDAIAAADAQQKDAEDEESKAFLLEQVKQGRGGGRAKTAGIHVGDCFNGGRLLLFWGGRN